LLRTSQLGKASSIVKTRHAVAMFFMPITSLKQGLAHLGNKKTQHEAGF
jgi:hypothetical protein